MCFCSSTEFCLKDGESRQSGADVPTNAGGSGPARASGRVTLPQMVSQPPVDKGLRNKHQQTKCTRSNQAQTRRCVLGTYPSHVHKPDALAAFQKGNPDQRQGSGSCWSDGAADLPQRRSECGSSTRSRSHLREDLRFPSTGVSVSSAPLLKFFPLAPSRLLISAAFFRGSGVQGGRTAFSRAVTGL